MTRLSRRYVPHMLVVLALGLGAVIAHSYLGYRRDSCAEPWRIAPPTRTDEHRDKRDLFMEESLAASQWREGYVRGEGGEARLRFAILRSYDAKLLYYRPEARLVPRMSLASQRSLSYVADGDHELPLRFLSYPQRRGAGSMMMAAYLLVHRAEPVADPYLNQLLAAPRQLVSGREPMTLYFISGVVPRDRGERTRERMIEWLTGSWHEHLEICRP